MFKKCISVILSLLLVVVLVACGEQLSPGDLIMRSIQKCTPVVDYSKFTTVYEMDTATFGMYPDGEPIEWIVLEKDDNKALLLSKYILDCKCYNEIQTDVTWETCTLRSWLNDTFYNAAFSDWCKSKILTTNVLNSNNNKYGTSGGNNTNDKIFCLSIDEVNRYFNQSNMEDENKRVATRGTNFAKAVNNNGYNLYVQDEDGWYYGNSFFWLRSPGRSQSHAALVLSHGFLGIGGDAVCSGTLLGGYGVRLAMWVNY